MPAKNNVYNLYTKKPLSEELIEAMIEKQMGIDMYTETIGSIMDAYPASQETMTVIADSGTGDPIIVMAPGSTYQETVELLRRSIMKLRNNMTTVYPDEPA